MKIMNQLINFFWTICGCSILIIHWYYLWNIWWFSSSILLSFSILIFQLKHLRFSKNRKFYEGFGIRIMMKFVQNGNLINNLIRKKKPYYNIINVSNYKNYLKTINMYERFHWIMAVFFFISTVYALINGQYIISITLILNNIWYNFYPIMLQQYNRLRILALKSAVL